MSAVENSQRLIIDGAGPPPDAPKPSKAKSMRNAFIRFADDATEIGLEVFKNVKKATKIVKKATGVADEFAKVPDLVYDILKFAKPFKIISGGLAVPKMIKGVKKVIHADDMVDRLLGMWVVYKSMKKITGAVETVGKYMAEFKLIPKAALAWTDIAGYIFMPATFLKAAVSGYDLSQKIILHKDFRANTKVPKGEEVNEERMEAMKKACTFIKSNKKIFKEGIVKKHVPIKERMESILERLQNENAEVRKLAFEEGAMIRKRLKDRISTHLVVSSIDTTIATAACAAAVFSLACPVASAPVAIIDLALGTAAVANYAYSRFIPSGDIFADEKPTIYARAFKQLSKAGHEMARAINDLIRQIQAAFNRAEKQLAGVLAPLA